MSGVFITFEGIEGVGKSTQVQNIRELLSAKNPGNIILTREPGGTRTGEAIRDIILQAGGDRIDGITEMLLVFAARCRHIQEVIRPALAEGKIVLCDRFTDATFAYQGGGRGVDVQLITQLQDMVQGELRPDLTFLLDAPVEVGLTRIRERSTRDRFEEETIKFFECVRQAYLDLADRSPERIHVIDATRQVEEVTQKIRVILATSGLC